MRSKRLLKNYITIVLLFSFFWTCFIVFVLKTETAYPNISNNSHGHDTGTLCHKSPQRQTYMLSYDVDPFDFQRMDKHILQADNCRRTRRPTEKEIVYRNTQWQVQRDNTHEIAVYSAYFDDRPDVGLLPVIRILAVSTMNIKNLFCQLWYSGSSYPLIVKVNMLSTGRPEAIHGVVYGQYLYTCAMPSSLPIPSHVSIVTIQCNQSSIFLPIQVPVRSLWQHEFGVCVAITFGNISIDAFVEWMEYHRLFGVSEINIYNGNITDPGSLRVFDFYQGKGMLRTYLMPPPVQYHDYKSIKRSSTASLNDCMLKNMYRYRYVIVVDLDEIIVPRVVDTYSEMLEYINRVKRLSTSAPSYTFRNVYFFLDIKSKPSKSANLLTMRHITRADPNRFLFASKSFVDPKRCISIFNHYCWITFPRYNRKWTINVDPKMAMSHHYRLCANHSCSKFMHKVKKDPFLLKYETLLSSEVNAVLQYATN